MELHNMRIALLSSGFIDYTIQLANALSEKGMAVLLMMPKMVSIEDDVNMHQI